MNQIVKEADIVSAIPLPAPGMTRREKLLRWAQLVRNHGRGLYLMHNLEHYEPHQLTAPCFHTEGGNTAFSVAMTDKVFADAGLKSSVEHLHTGTGAIADIIGFMELTQAQLHEFSCDCGGAISNSEMADRIERLA